MKTRIVLTAIALIFAANIVIAQNYSFDKPKTIISWVGKKVTGQHNGGISIQSGDFTVKDGKITSGKFLIDMNSITCADLTNEEYNKKLIGHLKSDDFFGVEKFPTAQFELKNPVKIEKGNTKLKGNITIKGITKPFEIKAVFYPVEDGYKIFTNFQIDRTQFNIKYGSSTFVEDLGDKTIYDNFDISMAIYAIKK